MDCYRGLVVVMQRNAGSTGARKLLAHIRIPTALAILSLAIYLCAALLLYQQEQGGSAYIVERSSLAAAVSKVAHGTPFGAVFSDTMASFETVDKPLNILIEQNVRGRPSGSLVPAVTDGSGLGYVVFATLAMQLFGPRLSAIIGLYFIITVMSALAFMWRYRDARLVAVPLYFAALTVILFTPLGSDLVFSDQFSVGGIRYFSLVGILPALHIFLEITDTRDTKAARRWPNLVALGIQVVILVLATLIRMPIGVTLVALALACLAVAWSHRRDIAIVRRTLFKAAYATLLGAAVVGALMVSLPKYVSEGRIVGTFWHRTFISIPQVHPEWPFGNLRERYDCTKYIPDGLTAANGVDRIGHCIWISYMLKHDIPMGTATVEIYGKRYEAALKEAFFDVLRSYPRQVLEAFTWYKQRLISRSIAQSLTFDLSGFANLQIFLLLASIGTALVFAVVSSVSVRSTEILLLGGATVMFAAFSIVPYLVAWAVPTTTAELLFFCLFALGLAASVTIGTILRSLRPEAKFGSRAGATMRRISDAGPSAS